MINKQGHLWIWKSYMSGYIHIQLWIANNARLVVAGKHYQGIVFRDNSAVVPTGLTLFDEEWVE